MLKSPNVLAGLSPILPGWRPWRAQPSRAAC